MVSWLRKKIKTKKIGHSGTLDPFAEGVLVMGIGKGTRILEYLKDEKKQYSMTFRLGLETDTYDIQGQIISDEDVQISEERISEAVRSMRGIQKQVPPIYSAKKYQGKKLYEYAREGKIIKMPPREITIESIEILKIVGRDVTIKAVVSPGTYMRSLAFDIGQTLSTTASAIELVRDVNGRFSSSDCIRMEEFSEDDPQAFYQHLRTINDALSTIPFVRINFGYTENVLNGNPVRMQWIEEYGDFDKGDLLRIVSFEDDLLAIGSSERSASFFQTLKAQNRNEIVVRLKKVFGEKAADHA